MSASFAKRQIVTDDLGNHFAVIDDDGGETVLANSVATKELFRIPRGELRAVFGLRERS